MKKDKFIDAVGMVGEDLIAEAETLKPKKRNKIAWVAVVAAVLLFTVALTAALRPVEPVKESSATEPPAEDVVLSVEPDTDSEQSTDYSQNLSEQLSGDEFVFAKAEYPERATNPNLKTDDATDSYEKWSAEKQEYKSAYETLEPDISEFVKKSIPAFFEGRQGNSIYSPVNVYMALSMLSEISDSDSRAQILDVLGYSSIEEQRSAANALWKALYTDDGLAKTVLANSLWLRDDTEYRLSTLETLADNYYASSFRGKMGTEEYDKALQAWLNEQTDDMLTDQINNLGMDDSTMMAVASTLLFNAKWESEFNTERTKEGKFHSPDGDMTCDFMNTSGSGYLDVGEKFTAVTRRFVENGHMALILPNEGVTPEELILTEEFADYVNCGGRNSSVADLTDKPCWETSRYAIINLSMPKFDVSSQMSLTEGLEAMGITDMTDETKADFSPILTSENDRAFLQEMIHGARVTVDEEGVSAASFVLGICGATSAPLDTVYFTLDRPFIFVIGGYDGLPLYIGIVNNV